MKKDLTIFKLILTALVLLFNNQVKGQTQPTNLGKTSPFDPLNQQVVNSNSNYNSVNLGKKVIKQRLDSVFLEKYKTNTNSYGNNEKIYYTYDYNEHLLSEIHTLWNDTLSKWQNYYKYLYSYDAFGFRTLTEFYGDWNRVLNQWRQGNKDDYTFDNKGNVITHTYYNWNVATQKFSVSSKTKTNHILNSNGNPTISYDSVSNSSNINTYSLSSKTENTYTLNGNISLTIHYYPQGTFWVPIVKSEYSYNSSGKTLVFVNSNYNNNNWVYSDKVEYTYDSKGNETSFINYIWNTQTNIWEFSGQKSNLTYDANNNIISHIDAFWNSTTKLWDNDTKDEFTYDLNGNKNSQIGYHWDKNNKTWVNYMKNQYAFNNNYVTNNLVCYYYNFDFFKHMLLGFTTQNWANNAWVNGYRYTLYYSTNNFNGVLEIEDANTNIFPNPTNGLVTISSTKTIEAVSVFDHSGKLVHSQTNYEKINYLQVDLSSLNNGIYFIHIQTPNGVVHNYKLILVQ